mgnify:CR=1 FL=1
MGRVGGREADGDEEVGALFLLRHQATVGDAVGTRRDVPDHAVAFEEAARRGDGPLTINGVHFHDAGEARLAKEIYPSLFGETAPAVETPEAAKVRALVNEKSAMSHSRYRSVDGYNIYGDRSKIAYVSHPDAPKITNTQVLMEEMAQRDVMTTNLERKVWAAAAGKSGSVEMLPLPVVTAFGTNKPGPNIDGTYPFVDGDEATKLMTPGPGLQVNLFASEKQFPELSKPVQMAWDTRGRLWVAVWPNYPERAPDSKVGDSLLIFEDTDGDGRADRFTVFAENLNIPTGFVFTNGGIVVAQPPRFLFLRDTNGDDRADERREVMTGWGVGDTHAQANNLHYGLDNWLYGCVGYSGFRGVVGGRELQFAQGTYRFRADGSTLEFLHQFTNNSWGQSINEFGDDFGGTANNAPLFFGGLPATIAPKGMRAMTAKRINTEDRAHTITPNFRQVDVFGGYTAAAGSAIIHSDNLPARLQGKAGGVIPPIFQALEAGEEDRDGGRAADVTDDAAHGLRR